MVKQHPHLSLAILRIADVATLGVAWYLAVAMVWQGYFPLRVDDMLPWIAVSALLTVIVFAKCGLYHVKRLSSVYGEALGVLRAVAISWTLTYLIVTASGQAKFGRLFLAYLLVDWLVLAALTRMSFRLVLRGIRRRAWNLRHAAIVGTGRLGQRLFHVIRKNSWTGIRPCYFVDEGPRRKLLGLDVLGPLESLEATLKDRPADIVFVAMSNKDSEKAEQVLTDLSRTGLDIRLVPDTMAFHFLRGELAELDQLPIVTLTHSPQFGWASLAKRIVDIVGALVGLCIFAVPMAIIALVIYICDGKPIFYLQERAGFSSRPFRIIKFRTMSPKGSFGKDEAARDESRITRVGGYLRRTSLDELPQLFNVLVGEMSLVGPRPEQPEIIERLRHHIPGYMLRNRARAGMTGLAQVHGWRGKSSLRKRIQYDLYYVSNWSLLLDFQILLATVFRGFVHPNAK